MSMFMLEWIRDGLPGLAYAESPEEVGVLLREPEIAGGSLVTITRIGNTL